METAGDEGYRYNGFFHHKDQQSIRPLVDWVAVRFERYVIALEHEDHANETDKHLQFVGDTAREFEERERAVWRGRGSLTKYLVDKKIANEGSKSAKRASLADWSKHGWMKCIAYVLKDYTPEKLEKAWQKTVFSDAPVESLIPLCGCWEEYQEVTSGTYEAFLMELWESKGRPKEYFRIVDMLIDAHVGRKWGNMRFQMLDAAARYLQSYGAPDRVKTEFREWAKSQFKILEEGKDAQAQLSSGVRNDDGKTYYAKAHVAAAAEAADGRSERAEVGP